MRTTSPRLNRVVPLVLGACLAWLGGPAATAQQINPGLMLDGIAGPQDAPPKEPVRPLSVKLGVKLPNVPVIEVTAPNVSQLAIEDAAATTGSLRQGVSRPVDFDPAMGAMYRVAPEAGGGWLWVLDVHAQGAFGVRLHMADFLLPKGADMIVYDPQIPGNLPSPYRERGLVDSGEFWAWTSWSDTARVEVYYPQSVGDDRGTFKIDQAIWMYRDPNTGRINAYGSRELGCYNDLACYPNWVTNGAGVGLMSFVRGGSSYGCTGSMLNDTAGDLTPYFMTAHHCMLDDGGALASLQVYWFYQEGTCNGSVPSLGSVPRSSVCTYVMSYLPTDMSMVMIEGAVPRNLWWSGNYSGGLSDQTPIVGIHHPASTRKRISFGNSLGSVACNATGLVNGFNVDYSSGTVEPGSSGSPLYLTNGAFIGQLSCGPSPAHCPGDGAEGLYGNWNIGFPHFSNWLNAPGSDDSNENNDACPGTNLNIYYNGTIYSQILKVNNPDWFHITVPAFGDVSFHAHFTSANGDIDMKLYDGCGGNQLGVSQGTSDDETINWHNTASSAREVYLNVYLYNDTRNSYYLDFSRFAPTPPANDACSSGAALDLGTGAPTNGVVYGQTINATPDGSTNCVVTGPDVWHRLTVACTRSITLDTEGSYTDFDTVLSVHTGCPGTAANQVVCNDDDLRSGTNQSSVTFTAVGGQNYYVRVSGYQGAAGHYQLNWYQPNASNDLCANSLDLAPGTYSFNNCPCDTDGPPEGACDSFGSNQIYKDFWVGYTPPCYGTIEVNTFAPTAPHLDTRIAVYANPDNSTCPPGPNTAIACNDDANSFYESQVIISCVPGQHYIFRIGSYQQYSGGAGTLHIIYTPADPCTPPVGACCSGGACSVVTQSDCLNAGGTYFGDGTDCSDPNLCVPPPMGACCVAGQCGIVAQTDCVNAGGTYFGDGTDCSDPNLCAAPTGACCLNGVCNILPQASCEGQGGVYFGDGTDCSDPNLCAAPVMGACCTAGVCSVATQAACEAGGGTYMGDGSDCSNPNLCTAMGACCTAGVCSVATLDDCTNGGGTYMGDGTDCSDPNICAAATGACCTINQCNVMTQADCDAAGGSWQGAATTCDGPTSCPAHCGSADYNCDGDVGTDADIEAYFACLSGNCPPLPCISNADFNGDGDVGTDADIEAFFRVLAGGNC